MDFSRDKVTVQYEDAVSIHTGFPNPATDNSIISLDINSLLIKHPSSTFFMRLSGEAWQTFGIFDSDIAIIDKSIEPRAGDIVVWWRSDEFCVSRYSELPKKTAAWGVITSIIHRYRV